MPKLSESDVSDCKRLFFGLEIVAPWPVDYPKGRLIQENQRHLTLAFLGDVSYTPLENHLTEIPPPSFPFALAGMFDRSLFLPVKHPSVIAWHINWFSKETLLQLYQKELMNWLKTLNFPVRDDRPLLSHVTIARTPFSSSDWISSFEPLPCMGTCLNLYESLGQLNYQSIWNHPFTPIFEEIEHTADIAFIIRGKTLQDLHENAQLALAFRFPSLLKNFSKTRISSLDELIIDLNEMITKTDAEIGCPFKALSFHGGIKQLKKSIEWEMIVDV